MSKCDYCKHKRTPRCKSFPAFELCGSFKIDMEKIIKKIDENVEMIQILRFSL